MPRKVKVHPNERIDIPDFERDTEYTHESVAQLNERLFQARYPLVVEGFRVRIEDQTSNPGEITVFNGTALNRDGKVLYDEEQNNASRSITLPSASTTFYVEIEFVETESDTDARAFWDPTFDQTDPIPDGKEFSINVATRKTPSWRIVSPVSTTDFEVNSNPDSTKIPIAKLTTNASGEIDGPADLVQVFPSTVLEHAVAVDVDSIRVFDSRLFNAMDVVTVGAGGSSPEDLTVSSIDYDNHVISFSSSTVSSHDEGAIVQRTSGTGRVIQQDTSPGVGFLDATSSTHPDASNYAFRGNEIRGGALVQSKETFGERDDLNLRSLKDQVDALSAVIRELKFGDTKPSVTSAAPPDSFVSEPRWVDAAGGVTGARTNSVSVGDGSSTFGDFNGISETTFQAAIDSLPSDGGLIFVKNGNYSINGTITIDKPVVIKGVGAATDLRNVGADPAFLINTTGRVKFEDVSIPDDGVLLDSIEIQTDVTLILDNVENLYRINITNSADPTIFARGVNFIDTIVTDTTESVVDSSFVNCTFAGNIVDVAFNDVLFSSCEFNGTVDGTFLSTSFIHCSFTDKLTVSSSSIQIMFRSCIWSSSGVIELNTFSTVYFTDCRFTPILNPASDSNTVTISGDASLVSFKACNFVPSVSGTSSSDLVNVISVESSDVKFLSITDCSLEMPSGEFGVGVNLTSGSSNNIDTNISGSIFFGFVSSISVNNIIGNLLVNNTKFSGNEQSLSTDFFGFVSSSSALDVNITNCVFRDYQNVAGDVSGISSDTTSDIIISSCTFEDIGSSGTSFRVRAISVDSAVADVTISNNNIHSAGGNVVEAIFVSVGASGQVCVNNNVITGLSGAGTSDDSGISIGTGSNILVVGNSIDASIRNGIIHNADGDNISIDDNIVKMGANSEIGIRVFADNLIVSNLSVSHNTVSGIEGGNTGIYLTLQVVSYNTKVNGNKVLEGIFDVDNIGILIEDATAAPSEGVSVSYNEVRGDISGISTDRNSGKTAIFVEYCNILSVQNNVLKWVGTSFAGTSLTVENCITGSVSSNIISPDDGTNFDINFTSVGSIQCTNNVVTDGTVNGSIDGFAGGVDALDNVTSPI